MDDRGHAQLLRPDAPRPVVRGQQHDRAVARQRAEGRQVGAGGVLVALSERLGQDEVELPAGREGESLPTARGAGDRVLLLAQDVRDDARDPVVLLDEQHAHFPTLPRPGPARHAHSTPPAVRYQ